MVSTGQSYKEKPNRASDSANILLSGCKKDAWIPLRFDVDELVLGLLLAMYVLDFSAEYFEVHLE